MRFLRQVLGFGDDPGQLVAVGILLGPLSATYLIFRVFAGRTIPLPAVAFGCALFAAQIAWSFTSAISITTDGTHAAARSTHWVASVFTLTVFNLLVAFANIYLILDDRVAGSWFNNHQPLTWLDALYLCVTTFTTVGSGSLSPDGQLARLAVAVESLISVVVVGVALVQLVVRLRRRP